MLKKIIGIFLLAGSLQACPFCASNLQQSSQGFNLGITASIFLLLGAVGSLTGFIVYQIIRQDKKRKA
jgi:hypothetical protein